MSLILPDRREYDALSRLSLALFIDRVFAELNPGEPFFGNWHIDLIVQRLEAARAGDITRLAINIPPRNLKSIIVSVAYVAWLLGHDPTAKIICASYNEDLAIRLGRMCLQVMQAKWYRTLFPRTCLTSDRPSAESFQTTRGGYRIATSVGGTLVGLGADYLIIDDPIKPEEVASDARRQFVNDWFSQSAITRLNDKRRGRIILIMQRLHEDDLTGYAIAQGGWTHLALAAIADEDETWSIETPFGRWQQHRHTGEPLHPEREPLAVLETLRASMGHAFFFAQYQQSPSPPGGGPVTLAWFQRFDLGDPLVFDRIVQSWDTGLRAKEFSSFSVCTTWGICNRKAYLLDVWRRRAEYPVLRRAVLELAHRYRPTDVLIEEAASGLSLIDDLRSDLSQVRGRKPVGDKVMRMSIQTAPIENGRVYLPRAASWLGDFEHELAMFPKGRYADQVDSVSQALQFIFHEGVEFDGWVEWTGQEAAKCRGKELASEPAEPRCFKVVALDTTNEIKTNAGRRVRPDRDGIFWLTEREAQSVRFMPFMKLLGESE